MFVPIRCEYKQADNNLLSRQRGTRDEMMKSSRKIFFFTNLISLESESPSAHIHVLGRGKTYCPTRTGSESDRSDFACCRGLWVKGGEREKKKLNEREVVERVSKV